MNLKLNFSIMQFHCLEVKGVSTLILLSERGIRFLVKEDRVLINDDLKSPDESFSHPHVHHEVEGFVFVGLARKDQGRIVRVQVFVFKMSYHLAGENQVV